MATQLVTPNLDPVIYQGGQALTRWDGWCLAYVQSAFGVGWAGARAWHAWENAAHKHADYSFPKGVYFPLFFSHWGTYGVYGNFGHVVIGYVHENGSMQIWSSPASPKPFADTYTSVEQIERIFSSTYVGWTEDLAGTMLIDITNKPVVDGGYVMDTIKSMYWRLLGREVDPDGLQHYSVQSQTRGWDFVYNDLKNSSQGQEDWQRRNPERVAALERGVEDRDRVINELKIALTQAQNKPAVEIVKEVEKIVHVPVEVIKEVPTAGYDPQVKEDISWIKNLLARIFK